MPFFDDTNLVSGRGKLKKRYDIVIHKLGRY